MRASGAGEIRLCQLERSVYLRQRALGGQSAASCSELSSLKIGWPALTVSLEVHINLFYPAGTLGQDRNGAIEGHRAGSRRVEVEDERQQHDGQSQAGRYPVAKLIPHRVERDLTAEPFSLHEAADRGNRAGS